MESKAPLFLYGTAWKEERTAALTELALRAGFRGIDTANQRRHYFEAAVGEGLRNACRAGIVTRQELFLQTKFTYRAGQDHRLPYDPSAPPGEQVRQSLTSSLEHLGTDCVDSFLLHGPASGRGWTDSDSEVWTAMLEEYGAGRTRSVGVSNVSVRHLEQMTDLFGEPPAIVQNRCFARFGWDREVRAFCRDKGIAYQGFSLLTANAEVLSSSAVLAAAKRLQATIPQIIFQFAREIGILPLTGTSDAAHMREDLASSGMVLTAEELAAIESVAD